MAASTTTRMEKVTEKWVKWVLPRPMTFTEFLDRFGEDDDNDCHSDIIARETDYRAIGVAEMWFIDQGRRRVRALRRADSGYDEEERDAGPLVSQAVAGFQIETDWLWAEPRPAVRPLLAQLLGEEAAG